MFDGERKAMEQQVDRLSDRIRDLEAQVQELEAGLAKVRPFLWFAASNYEDGETEKSAKSLALKVDALLAQREPK